MPTPSVESFRTWINELAMVNPKAQGQDANGPDDDILEELDKSQFIGRAWPVMVREMGPMIRLIKLLEASPHRVWRRSIGAR